MNRLLLVRHCSSAWSPDNTSRPLSALGHTQALALRDWLLDSWPVDAVISSPYRRAIDTIAPFAGRAGLPIALDQRLRERETPFAASAEDHTAAAEASFADHSLRLGGAESGREAQERGWQAVADALASPSSLPVLVSHGQLLSFTLARVDGTSGAERWRAMTTPDVFLLELLNGVHTIERVWEAPVAF